MPLTAMTAVRAFIDSICITFVQRTRHNDILTELLTRNRIYNVTLQMSLVFTCKEVPNMAISCFFPHIDYNIFCTAYFYSLEVETFVDIPFLLRSYSLLPCSSVVGLPIYQTLLRYYCVVVALVRNTCRLTIVSALLCYRCTC